MPIVIVTDYAYQSIQNKAFVPFEQKGTQRPNGDWEVWVSAEMIERLKPNMLPHESVGEAIARWWPTRVGVQS